MASLAVLAERASKRENVLALCPTPPFSRAPPPLLPRANLLQSTFLNHTAASLVRETL
jgi:hypothetical protein